jgi:hypothetical protein
MSDCEIEDLETCCCDSEGVPGGRIRPGAGEMGSHCHTRPVCARQWLQDGQEIGPLRGKGAQRGPEFQFGIVSLLTPLIGLRLAYPIRDFNSVLPEKHV